MKSEKKSKIRERGGGGMPSATPGLYLRLVVVWYVLFTAATALFCSLVVLPIRALHPLSVKGVLSAATIIVVMCGLYFVIEMLSLGRGRDFLPFISLAKRRALFRMLYPLCNILGRLFGRSQEAVSASLIALINQLTRIAARGRGEGGILVLLPRCVQNSKCTQRIAEDIAQCKRCGKCDIARVVEMMEKYRFRVAVVGGGELARKKVHELSPSFVIAVACERELLEGISAVSDVPVIGIPNRRPEGPCTNTVIDIDEFEKAVRLYSGER
ncbi:MAG: DUF116 domain-containing protein [Candidatus Aureabacteria bacterium]|nr:DUF116 domain-containing protein [Candidatus Auribacterota bacterium]